MLEIGIYRKTIIPFKIPLLVALIGSTVGFLIIQRDYRRAYQKNNLLFPIIQSFISFGFIACYLFMTLNYYLADNATQTKSVTILARHTIGTGNGQPAIEIEYEGIKKQLVFYNGQQKQLDTSKQVILTVKKGLFGFIIFSDIQLR